MTLLARLADDHSIMGFDFANTKTIELQIPGFDMAKRISVVVSQGQSKNPAKRNLEEEIITALMMESGVDVTVIPHLYDLKPDGTGFLALQGISGNLIVLTWLFERAAHWILDRNGVNGKVGTTLIRSESDDEDEDDEEFEDEATDEKSRVVESREIPNRFIYCLDLRSDNSPQVYIEEVKRIASEQSQEIVSIGLGGIGDGLGSNGSNGTSNSKDGSPSNKTTTGPTEDQANRFAIPTNTTALSMDGSGLENPNTDAATANGESGSGADEATILGVGQVNRIEEPIARRWYPVIDYSRCTNCMECIDFCLFGVYGIDNVETILVEQPDNCRKGCPACSRVCPENAIIFPQHKTPAIAGSPETTGGLKIDLSLLFGAPESGKSAEEIAALERDEQLVMAGRDAVGMSVGMPKRQADKSDLVRDELDDLVDELDDLDI